MIAVNFCSILHWIYTIGFCLNSKKIEKSFPSLRSQKFWETLRVQICQKTRTLLGCKTGTQQKNRWWQEGEFPTSVIGFFRFKAFADWYPGYSRTNNNPLG